jgi:hypothetical protein
MRRRGMAAALAACLVLGGASGCSSDDGTKEVPMKISGDCALGDSELALTQLVPESVIGRLVGTGDYDTTAGLVVKDGKLPAAYNGTCALVDADGQDVLRLAMYNRKDESYARAQQMLAAGDATGFAKVDDSTFVLADEGEGAVQAWTILPERIIILRVLEPKKGVDAAKEVGSAMAEVTTRVQARSGL